MLGGAVLLGHAGRVAGEGGVDADADVGAYGIGGGAGAAEANLLLRGEAHVDLGLAAMFAEGADRLDPEPAGDAVVERLGDELVADLLERGIEGHHVADLDPLARGLAEAEVDIEGVEFGHLLAFLGGRDVDRLAAGVEHALEVAAVGRDEHAAGEEGAGVEAAHRLEVEPALLGDVADEEADLVHMAEEHDLRAAGAVTPAEQRAHRVHPDLVE